MIEPLRSTFVIGSNFFFIKHNIIKDHTSKSYDFIFAGAGCATLSILVRMIDSEKFSDKNILLLDKQVKNKNDRTWCFWEKQTGYFENIIHKKWNELLFKADDLSIDLEIAPYQYKMIRSIDFYNHAFSKIDQQNNIDIQYGEISFDSSPDKTIIKLNEEVVDTTNSIIFNSIYQPAEKQRGEHYLLQHFKGYVIETTTNVFNLEQGLLMDFSVHQKHGTTFMYVLPLTSNKALVEYTLFTENLLAKEEYDSEIKKYLHQYYKLSDYKIIEEEFGIIPMTSNKFKAYENGMYNIGTAGGQTKASTGYTFQFLQKQAQQIVQELILNGVPSKKINIKKRFQFYDSTLLHILAKNKLEGKEIFTKLFQKNKASAVFKFLDNETHLKEELRIISSLPTKEFLSAGVKEFFRMLKAHS